MTKNKFIWVVSIFLIAIISFVLLRFTNLNSVPVFVDEAIYVRWSQVMRQEPTLRFLPMSDGKQPLYMWVTIPFLKVFSDPLIAARGLSIASGFGSMLGLVFLTQILFSNPLISALSALLYSVTPFTVFFDRMALADSMLAMFGIWSLWLAILFVKSGKLEHAMFLGYALGCALLTKSPAIFFYFWVVLTIPFFIKRGAGFRDNFLRLSKGLFTALIISQVMKAILILGPNSQMAGTRNLDYMFTFKEVISHPLSPFIGNMKSVLNWIWLLLTPSSIVLYFLSWANKQYRKDIILLTLVSFLPLIALSSVARVFTSRYILFAVYPLIPVFALGLSWLITRKGLLIKLSTAVLIFIPLVISVMYLSKPEQSPLPFDMRNGYYEEWTAGWGNKQIASYLINLENKGEKIVVFTEGYFGTMPDGLQIYLEGHKNITVVGSPPNVSKIPDGLLSSAKTNQNFLVVNKSRNKLTTADLSRLILVEEYPKFVRKDGTREVLQFYKLK